MLAQVSVAGNDIWLGMWSADQFGYATVKYIYIYAIIAIGSGLLVFFRGIMFGFFTQRTAVTMQC